ncbi:MAG: two pore domain potassium channel family protein [Chloroflexi bacterium]|nr:MAG: two pore domain potassium channel family protein [Chloroflexota bacterium]
MPPCVCSVSPSRRPKRTSAEGTAFWYLGPALFLIWVGAAIAYFQLEHGVNPSVRSFGDALYWVFITATTVGYGDITPVTPAGRILAGVLIFLGIGLVGILSARFTQRWLKQEQGDVALLRRIDGLEKTLASMHGVLVEMQTAFTRRDLDTDALDGNGTEGPRQTVAGDRRPTQQPVERKRPARARSRPTPGDWS